MLKQAAVDRVRGSCLVFNKPSIPRRYKRALEFWSSTGVSSHKHNAIIVPDGKKFWKWHSVFAGTDCFMLEH
jgi:hypothetical protein